MLRSMQHDEVVDQDPTIAGVDVIMAAVMEEVEVVSLVVVVVSLVESLHERKETRSCARIVEK
jgi:hypothetical protein